MQTAYAAAAAAAVGAAVLYRRGEGPPLRPSPATALAFSLERPFWGGIGGDVSKMQMLILLCARVDEQLLLRWSRHKRYKNGYRYWLKCR